jgi:hypothetical protein
MQSDYMKAKHFDAIFSDSETANGTLYIFNDAVN